MKIENIRERKVTRFEEYNGHYVPEEIEYKQLAELCGWSLPPFSDHTKFYSDFVGSAPTKHSCIDDWVAIRKRNGPFEVQHFTFDKCCEAMLFNDDVLCIRYVKSKNKLIAAKHKMGMCPYCTYEWPEGIEP